MGIVTDRLDWSIFRRAAWFALHKDGTVLTAATHAALMSEINIFEQQL